jgi:hypothetical protein
MQLLPQILVSAENLDLLFFPLRILRLSKNPVSFSSAFIRNKPKKPILVNFFKSHPIVVEVEVKTV